MTEFHMGVASVSKAFLLVWMCVFRVYTLTEWEGISKSRN
jgi:hypothetical protein